MCFIRCRQHFVALVDHLLRLSVMHLMWRKQAKAGMVMLVVVPVEKGATKGLSVLQATETVRKFRPVLERLELRFRVRIVIARPRATVSFRDAESRQQLRHHL